MRLAFDLDGTIADLQGALAREARRLFPGIDPGALPRSAPAPDQPDQREEASPDGAEEGRLPTAALNGRQQHELWQVVCASENFWETLDEIEPGALKRLSHLAEQRRWELMFLTSRPETRGNTAQSQSHRWLVAHGFHAPSVFVVHGSRGKIAAALGLDVLVDDRPENCLDVAIDSSARAILVWRGNEAKVPASARQLGIGAVQSLGECLDILERLDREGDTGVGVVDRLKRLLGLKPQAVKPRDSQQPAAAAARE